MQSYTYAAFSLLLTGIQIVALTSGCQAAEQNYSYFIRQVLLKGYDPLARPVLNSSRPLYLSVSLGISSFIALDMKQQTLVSFGWLTVNWHDRLLSWDVGEHPYKLLFLSSSMLWRPDLVVLNTVTRLDQLADQKIKLTVRNDGKITWYPGGLFQTFCSIDISHYPLDTQTCSIDIISWSGDRSVIDATLNDPVFDVTNTRAHPEWTLVRTEAVYELRTSGYWVVKFKFTLKRKVLFYVVNIILPIVLLSLMNCLVFLLPVESGEKMTVSVTVFLSFAVFMSLIKDSLPQNSDSLCLFSAFVAVQMFLSACSIAMAAVIVFIFGGDSSSSDLSSPYSYSSMSTENKIMSHSAGLNLRPQSAVFSSATSDTECSSATSDPTISFPDTDAPSATGFSGLSVAKEVADRGGKRTPPGFSNGQKGSLSIGLVWQLMKRVRLLAPADRRLLSRTLDSTCFLLTLSINIFSCLTFIVFMAAT